RLIGYIDAVTIDRSLRFVATIGGAGSALIFTSRELQGADEKRTSVPSTIAARRSAGMRSAASRLLSACLTALPYCGRLHRHGGTRIRDPAFRGRCRRRV